MAEQRSATGMRPHAAQVVASFTAYEDVQRAVELLADRSFPVEHTAIVTSDVRFVEQVTGRRGYADAAADGAIAGGVTGAALGFILGVLTLITPLTSALALALWGIVIGAVMGALVGLISHALMGTHRNFGSVRGLQAGRYDLVVAAEHAERARQLLQGSSDRAAA